MINVLHLNGIMSWNGGEKQLVTLVTNLNKLKYSNNIIFCFNNSELHKKATELGIKTYSIDRKKTFSPKAVKELAGCVKKNKIDIIHIHTSNMVMPFLLYSIFYNRKIKAVFSKKSDSNYSSMLSMLKYNYPKIKSYLCTSKKTKESFRKLLFKWNYSKIKVIFDGIDFDRKIKDTTDLREIYNISKEKVLIGNIANHTKAKDLTTFVKTIHYLVNKMSKDIYALQIGDFKKDVTPKLRSLITEYHLENNIILTGRIDNASSFLEQFDISLITSESEGGPLIIPESFLANVPVVTTDVGVASEVIKNGKNGFVCKIKDYKDLAQKISLLIDNKVLVEKIPQKSYKIVYEKFDIQQCVTKTFNIYQDVLR